jgi:hypothetical protein
MTRKKSGESRSKKACYFRFHQSHNVRHPRRDHDAGGRLGAWARVRHTCAPAHSFCPPPWRGSMGCRRGPAPAAERSKEWSFGFERKPFARAREAGGERRDATPRLPSRGAGAAAPSVGWCPCPAVASCGVASGAGSCFHGQLTSCVCAACVFRACRRGAAPIRSR